MEQWSLSFSVSGPNSDPNIWFLGPQLYFFSLFGWCGLGLQFTLALNSLCSLDWLWTHNNLLPWPPEYWDYRNEPPCPAHNTSNSVILVNYFSFQFGFVCYCPMIQLSSCSFGRVAAEVPLWPCQGLVSGAIWRHCWCHECWSFCVCGYSGFRRTLTSVFSLGVNKYLRKDTLKLCTYPASHFFTF